MSAHILKYTSVYAVNVGLGLTTRQPLWVILCRFPEKGRNEVEKVVEEMKGTGKKDEQERKWKNRKNKNISPLPLPATRIAGLAQL